MKFIELNNSLGVFKITGLNKQSITESEMYKEYTFSPKINELNV